MKSNVEKIYNDLFERYPALSCAKEDVEAVFEIIKEIGGKVTKKHNKIFFALFLYFALGALHLLALLSEALA